MIKDSIPSQEPPHPPKVQHSVILLQEKSSKMTDFYETWNLSLLSSKEHTKNVIIDPSPSQDTSSPPKLQQSVIILQVGTYGYHINFFCFLIVMVIGAQKMKPWDTYEQLAYMFLCKYNIMAAGAWECPLVSTRVEYKN